MTPATRTVVRDRAESRYEYCQLPTRGQVASFEIDHVWPRDQGGTSDLDNLAFACPHCNACKWNFTHGLDPIDGVLVPLFNPRSESWAKHFRYSASEPAVIEGITAVGRATMERLKMNSSEMILIRRMLAQLEISR